MVVRIGVIGAGRAGMIHARALRAAVDDAVLVGVSDPNPEARADAARARGVPAFAAPPHRVGGWLVLYFLFQQTEHIYTLP